MGATAEQILVQTMLACLITPVTEVYILVQPKLLNGFQNI